MLTTQSKGNLVIVFCLEELMEESLFSLNRMGAVMRFTKLHLNRPQELWNEVLWTYETTLISSAMKCQDISLIEICLTYTVKTMMPIL